MIAAIISGGQTGADRGALTAAIQLNLGFGGWAPAGYRAEDGVVPEIFRVRMRETNTRDYGLRTRLNIQDSDATLIVSFATELSGGSSFTAKHAKQQRKPCKHLVLPARGETRIPDVVRSAVLEWLRDRRIGVLNVAGPRESKEPGIEQAVCDALVWILEDEVEESTTVGEFSVLGVEHDAGEIRLEDADRLPIEDAIVQGAVAMARPERGTFVVPREVLYQTDRVAPALARMTLPVGDPAVCQVECITDDGYAQRYACGRPAPCELHGGTQ